MKYKKYFKLKYNNNNIFRYDSMRWGEFGLKAVEFSNLTSEQLNAAVKSLKRIIKRKNFLIIRCNPF
jgi:ribosomal protein L16/L10AE